MGGDEANEQALDRGSRRASQWLRLRELGDGDGIARLQVGLEPEDYRWIATALGLFATAMTMFLRARGETPRPELVEVRRELAGLDVPAGPSVAEVWVGIVAGFADQLGGDQADRLHLYELAARYVAADDPDERRRISGEL